MFILNEYIENEITQVTEYTKDGETISHIVRTPIQKDLPQLEMELEKEEQRQKYIRLIQEAQLLGETEEVERLQQEWKDIKQQFNI